MSERDYDNMKCVDCGKDGALGMWIEAGFVCFTCLIDAWKATRRPPVDSVGVDMPASCEECPVLKHCNWHYGRHQESGTIYEGPMCKSLLFDHFAALTAPADVAPVDSVGVDVEKVRSVLSQVEHWERHTPDVPGAQHYHKGRLNSWIKQLRAALTAPADGCPACGANWDSEHNRCEGNCDKLLSEKEG